MRRSSGLLVVTQEEILQAGRLAGDVLDPVLARQAQHRRHLLRRHLKAQAATVLDDVEPQGLHRLPDGAELSVRSAQLDAGARQPPQGPQVALLDDPDQWTAFGRPVPGREGVWESYLAIEGMHCAACTLAVEGALQPLPGVRAVQVNGGAATARIEWCPEADGASRPSDWLASLRRAGYGALPAGDLLDAEPRRREQRKLLWRWLVAGFGMMQAMMYSYPLYIAAPGEIPPDQEALLRWGAWMMTVPVMLFSCWPFFATALRDLTRRRLGMDVPVALALAIAFLASTAATFDPSGPWGREVWYDSVTMFVFFLLSGRLLEARLRDRTAGALEALARALPASVLRLDPATGEFHRVPVRRLALGDLVRVLPGEVIPADGRVESGESRVDEALLTGESGADATLVAAAEGHRVVSLEEAGATGLLGLGARGLGELAAACRRLVAWASWGEALAAACLTGCAELSTHPGQWGPDGRVSSVVGFEERRFNTACLLSARLGLSRTQAGQIVDHGSTLMDMGFGPTEAMERCGVLDAAKALDSATAKGDAAAIRAAMQALEQIARGEVVAAPAAAEPVATPAQEAPATSESADVAAEGSAEAISTDAAEVTNEAPAAEASESEVPAEPVAEVAPVKPKAAPRPVVAVRGDDRPGQKRTEAAPAGRGRDGKPGGKFGDKPGFGRDGKPGRDGGRDGGREGFAPRGPRLGDAAFRAQRHALESAQDALRRLAAQAHGEVLTQLMHAWEKRDAAQVPAAQAIGSKLNPAQRTQWAQAVSAEAKGEVVTPLLRLEVAADLPTPAAHMDARRALQLQMLTRRNDPSPQMTWAADAAQVLGGAYDEAAARRLQAALKVLLKR